jgi:hypothetical protein
VVKFEAEDTAMSSSTIPASPEADILNRLVSPDEGSFPPEAAAALLTLKFAATDIACMERLAERSQAGTLTPEERRLMEVYNHIGHFLALIKSKARKSLNRNGSHA